MKTAKITKMLLGLWGGLVLLGIIGPGMAQSTPATGRSAAYVPVKDIAVRWQGTAFPDSARFTNQVKRFIGQPLSPAVLKQIRTSTAEFLRQRGYYFPRLEISKDSSRAGYLTLLVNPGALMVLDTVQIHWQPDSLKHQVSPEVLQSFFHRPYLPDTPQRLQEMLENQFSNIGYPLATVAQDEVTVQEGNPIKLRLTLRVLAGPRVVLRDFLFEGKSPAEKRYLQRLIGFKAGELYQTERITKYRLRLSRLPFVETVGRIHLVQDSLKHFYLVTRIKEKPATAFDGVVGYVPPRQGRDEKGYMVGNVTIGVRNLLGPGRELQLFWRKPDPLSENFHLAYRESFVLGFPLHLVGGLNRQVRDTTYIEWQYTAQAEIPITEDTRLTASVTSRSVFPDTLASRQLRLPRTESIRSALTVHVDQRNSFSNPTRGFTFQVQFSLERQRNLGPAYLLAEDSLVQQVTLQRITGRLAFYVPVRKNHVLSNALQVQWVSSSGKRLFRPDLFYFGGSRTIRGYREDQFVSDRLVWVNTEYRVLTGPLSRIFAFVDNGAYYQPNTGKRWRFLLGYGLGARFRGPLGIMQVELALARGEPFRETKIHFRIINEF